MRIRILLLELVHQVYGWDAFPILYFYVVYTHREAGRVEFFNSLFDHCQAMLRLRQSLLVRTVATGNKPDFVEAKQVDGFGGHLRIKKIYIVLHYCIKLMTYLQVRNGRWVKAASKNHNLFAHIAVLS